MGDAPLDASAVVVDNASSTCRAASRGAGRRGVGQHPLGTDPVAGQEDVRAALDRHARPTRQPALRRRAAGCAHGHPRQESPRDHVGPPARLEPVEERLQFALDVPRGGCRDSAPRYFITWRTATPSGASSAEAECTE